ncbi:MAG: hypothetical protein KAX49_17670 [Halanaerobiales bacterium]|nr:hypothetical protein [Halanaerobiales bacterium]
MIEVADLDWIDIEDEIDEAEVEDGEKRTWLGNVYGLTPSGKFYAFWTTNQTEDDVERDSEWLEQLIDEAEKRGLWVDFDNEDIFIGKTIED